MATKTTLLAVPQKNDLTATRPSNLSGQNVSRTLEMSSPNGRMAVDRLDAELSPSRKSYVSCRYSVCHNVLIANKRYTLGLELTRLTPPVLGGHKGPFPESDGTEAVGIETENTTVVAATGIAAVEAGTVIVTETETGNTAATTTNADAVATIETKTVVVETVTARETKGTTGNDEGRGKTM